MKVTVIATVYNQAPYIHQMISSVLCQKPDFDFEFIIANDFSTDKSGVIIKEFADKDNRIVFINNPKNLGLLKNYAQCLERAKGKYIAQLGGDDFWINKDKLQLQADFLDNNPEHGMVHTQYDVLYTYSKFLQKVYKKNYMSKAAKIEGDIFYKLIAQNSINAITVCFIASIIKNSGIIEKLRNQEYHVEDLPMWLTISKSYKVGYLDISTICYRQRKESLSHFRDIDDFKNFIDKSKYLALSFLSDEERKNSNIKEALKQRDSVNYTYLYFKNGDFKNYRKYFKDLKVKTFSRIVMYWVLFFKLDFLFNKAK